ncbi:MAG TPA: DUF3105 domain-containing protein [Actinomycetota bacterium]|nr:DUF3105 domain-containing protein [Actinomycetota bacterium]
MADEPTSKKLLEKQQRRAAEEERRREQQKAARKRNLITLLIAVVIIAIIATLVIRDRESQNVAAAGVDPKAAGCTEIEEHEEEGAEHVDTEPVYQTNPPTSGDHLQTPAQSGFFDEPVRTGALVHNMEHGQIIFWYDPDAPQKTLDLIEAVVEQEPVATIAVPWDELEGSYNFAMTAWGAAQHCREVSQEVVDAFRERYQGRGPEQIPGIETFEA